MEYSNCTSIDLSNADSSKVTNMGGMFSFCKQLTELDLNGFDTSNVTHMGGLVSSCYALTTLDLSSFDTSNVTDMTAMFSGTRLTSLDLSSFDTSKVTNMSQMFVACSSLTTLDLSNFDTSNVTDMVQMFSGCSRLTSVDVSSFDTSKVTRMASMFSGCNNLTTLDVSGFDTSNATVIGAMFFGCYSLKSLDLSNFDTSSATDMYRMFYCCSALTSLDLSNFDTSKVTRMTEMFAGCFSLANLDLSNFNTSQVKSMDNMFIHCNKLRKLTLGQNFKKIPEEAALPNGSGWVNVKSPTKVISGDGDYAVIENNGKNTYKLYGTITYPTNIKYNYSDKYRQIQFTWDPVACADKYGIAVYLAGKWKIQTQNISGTSYTTPKNSITPGKTYKVAIAARVNGEWDTANAIKNAVTIAIPTAPVDKDGDGYVDKYEPNPDYKDDYSFLDNEIYSIRVYHDDENYSNPIEAISGSSVKTTNKANYECDDKNYFRFKWCGNGYKIYSVKYESNNKVLTINQSGDVVLEEDKGLPSQLWEVLPYEIDKDGYPIDGLRFRSKMWYTPDGKTTYFLSYDGTKLKASTTNSSNKVKIFSPTEWTRFGELYLNYMGWEDTNVSNTAAKNYINNVKNYNESVKSGVIKDNIVYYKGHALLVYQNGGIFQLLKFRDQTMDGVCCEIMGTYNALVLHDEPVDFLKLAVEFEANATSDAPFGDNGWAGSNPYKIGNCLDAYNVEYTTINNKLNLNDTIETIITVDDYSDVDSTNKASCDEFDKELKNEVCGIISYKFATDCEGYLPFELTLPDEAYLGIHTYATVYNSYSASPISTFNLLCGAEPKEYPIKYLSTYEALKNYDKYNNLKNIDLYLVGYILK